MASYLSPEALKKYNHTKTIEILLADSDEQQNDDEIVYVSIPKDLTDDPTELCALLENTPSLKPETWLSIAVSYALQNKFKQAQEVIASALSTKQLEGAAPQALFPFRLFEAACAIRKARSPLLAEERQQAVRNAEESVDFITETNPALVSTLLVKAALGSLKGEDVMPLVDNILQQDPSNVFALFTKAKALYRKRNYAPALRLFQQVLILNPMMTPDPRIGVGLCFWALGDAVGAESAWSRAREVRPADAAASTLDAVIKAHSAFNESASDSEFITKYTALMQNVADVYTGKVVPSWCNPDDNENKALQKNNAHLLAILALYLYSSNKDAQLYSMVESFLRQDQALLDKYSALAVSDLYFWMARMYFRGNVLEIKEFAGLLESDLIGKAQQSVTRALHYDKNNTLARFLGGQIQLKKGNRDESILIFETILKTGDPKLVEVHYVLGLLYHERVFEKNTVVLEENTEHVQKLNTHLETYFKRCLQTKERVVVNAHLAAAKNYEYLNKLPDALSHLEKAAELYKKDGEAVPAELVNNIGVYRFLRGEQATAFFDENSLEGDAAISVLYNSARAGETASSGPEIYDNVLSKAPNHISAQTRALYLRALKEENIDALDAEIKALVAKCPLDKEVRAFYTWFLHRFRAQLSSYKEAAKTGNPEEEFLKETLTKYDSHDEYALVCLGNLYVASARGVRPGKTKEAKQSSFYIRAAQLFQKALLVEPHNLYAAQGLAIIFAEMKRPDLALEIFKKIRDALDDALVYLNLGHCLVEVKQYARAIECYEIVVNRYGKAGHFKDMETVDVFSDSSVDDYVKSHKFDGCESTYYTLLGRAWYMRGVGEKSLDALQNALKYSKQAYLIAAAQAERPASMGLLRFNIAFVYFQIAEAVRRLATNKRTLAEIERTISGLQLAIAALERLAQGEGAPYPAQDLTQRASMGGTLLTALQKELESQALYEREFSEKIEEGKRLREQERKKMEEEARIRKEREEEAQKKLRAEREELQKRAAEWAAELAELNKTVSQEKKKKKRDEDGFVLQSSSDESEHEDEEEKGKKKGKKRRKSEKGGERKERKRSKPTKPTKPSKPSKPTKPTKPSRKFKSADFINDSDEDLDDVSENRKRVIEDDEDQELKDLEKDEEEVEESAIEMDEDQKEDEKEEEAVEKEEERKEEQIEDDGDEGDDLF